MNVDETTQWVAGLFPGTMQVGTFGPCQVAVFDASPEFIACTLNTADVDTGVRADQADVRSEIFTVCEQRDEAHILVSAAQQMLIDAKGAIPARPGEQLPGLATLARRFDLSAKHGLFTVPFVWGSDVPQVKLPDRWTLMLQLVLLTDEEYVYLNTYGLDALQQELARAEINIQDLCR